MEREWLSTGEVARSLALHPVTIKRWAKRGLIPGYRFGPRGDWRFERTEIEKWLAKQKVSAAARSTDQR